MNQIYWILAGNKELGSSRIHGLNIDRKLKQLKYNSSVIIAPEPWMDDLPFDYIKYKKYFGFIKANDILIFQKVLGKNALKLINFLQLKSVRIFYINCDLPLRLEYINAKMNIITPSRKMYDEYKSIMSGNKNCHYIPDCPEYFLKTTINKKKTKLKSVWFGYYDSYRWNDYELLKQLIRNNCNDAWKLISISNTEKADYQWEKKSARKIISKCDAVVIPIFNMYENAGMKSANKVIQAMALNVPVLASPIDAYEEVIINGFNGFICHNEEEWIKNLTLLQDTDIRESIRNRGFETAQKYKLDSIINIWIEVLDLNEKYINKTNLTNIYDLIMLRYIFLKNMLKQKRSLKQKVKKFMKISISYPLISLVILIKYFLNLFEFKSAFTE